MVLQIPYFLTKFFLYRNRGFLKPKFHLYIYLIKYIYFHIRLDFCHSIIQFLSIELQLSGSFEKGFRCSSLTWFRICFQNFRQINFSFYFFYIFGLQNLNFSVLILSLHFSLDSQLKWCVNSLYICIYSIIYYLCANSLGEFRLFKEMFIHFLK